MELQCGNIEDIHYLALHKEGNYGEDRNIANISSEEMFMQSWKQPVSSGGPIFPCNCCVGVFLW